MYSKVRRVWLQSGDGHDCCSPFGQDHLDEPSRTNESTGHIQESICCALHLVCLTSSCLQVAEGDLITCLNVYKAWEKQTQNQQQWCQKNYVNHKALLRAQDIKKFEHVLRLSLCGIPGVLGSSELDCGSWECALNRVGMILSRS